MTTTHPALTYVKDLPGVLATIRQEIGDVRRYSRYLLPFVWRATYEEGVENAAHEGFDLGRETERFDAGRREAAPAVGGVLRITCEATGLSVDEAAERVGIRADSLELIERGEVVASGVLVSQLTETLSAELRAAGELLRD